MRKQARWTAGMLLLALWLPVRADVAETPQLRLIGPSDGLPSTDILGLGQDQDGYLWIATMDGLARYDGVEMDVWRHVPEDSGSLPENGLQSLHIDADDRVWVGTMTRGAAALDATRQRFVRYNSERFPVMRSDLVMALASEPGAIWLGTADGLYRIDTDASANEGNIHTFLYDADNSDSLPGSAILGLDFDSRGTLWIASTGGLARIDGDRLQRVPLPGAEPFPFIYSAIAQGEVIWIGSANGVFFGNGDGNWEKPAWSEVFARPNAAVTTVVDPSGGLWIGSQRGAWRVTADGIPTPLPPTVEQINRPVQTLFMQHDGALWVPVFGQGLGYLRADWRRLMQFSSGSATLGGDHYRDMALAADGGVWLLARNGVVEHVSRHGVAGHLPANIAEQIRSARPRAFAVDEDGAFWIGTPDSVLRAGREGGIERWTRDAVQDAALPGLNHIFAVAPGHRVWMGSNPVGLQLRDTRTHRVLRNFLAAEHIDSGFDLGDLEQMEIGPDGVLWIAGADGIAWLDDNNGIDIEPALHGQRVLAFGFDGTNALWLFRNNQLQRFELEEGRWKHAQSVGVAQGLPPLEAGGLRVDSRHRVWLSSRRGLYCWDPASGHMQHVGVQNGLHNQEFVKGVLALDSDGMLFGTTIDGGVIAIDTHRPDLPSRAHALHLKHVAVWRGGQWQARDVSQGLTLAHDEPEFRISLRLVDYTDPSSHRYWSRLDGHDADWVEQHQHGERVFSGVQPGRYRLHMRALDAAGSPAEAPVLHVQIHAPWWNSSSFHILLLAAGLAMVIALAVAYRHHLHRRHVWQLAKAQREMAEHASLAKTRFLATLGHEVRTPMTGVLGMSELLLGTRLNPEQHDYAQSIRSAGQHLLRLVNDALDLARIEADRLELERQPFDLRQMLAEIAALEAPLANARGLDFEHRIAPNVPRWLLGDAGRVRQIVLNLIGNAIKFTEHGRVTLHAEPLAPEGIRLVISDTGPGLNAEQSERLFRRFEQADGVRTAARYGGSGLGLAISQELAAAMAGRIDVESIQGQGTRFIVALPLPETHPPATHVPDPQDNSLPRRGLNLLLVEDNATVAAVIIGLLRTQGYTVTHASHGLVALAEVARHRFDLAFLDLDLPGIDGLRLAGLMREQGFQNPLIALTARSDAEAEPAARQAGFSQFMRKPVTAAMLVQVIEQALSSSHDVLKNQS